MLPSHQLFYTILEVMFGVTFVVVILGILGRWMLVGLLAFFGAKFAKRYLDKKDDH